MEMKEMKEINCEVFSGEVAVLWPRGSTGAAELPSALFPTSQPGLSCHCHGGRKTDEELANCCLQQSKIMAQH